MRLLALAIVLVGVLWLSRARSRSNVPSPALEYPPGVPLEVSGGLAGDGHSVRLELRHVLGAHFYVEYEPATPSGDAPFVVTHGVVGRFADSDPQGLLHALAEAHLLQGGLAPTPAEQLTIDVGILGEGLSRGDGAGTMIAGEFWTEPEGTWTVLKLFLPDAANREPGELFLVFDVSAGTAEFLVKDPAYWPTLLESLGPRL